MEEFSEEDQAWLDAIAGRASNSGTGHPANATVQSLRRVLKSKKAKLAQTVPFADEEMYARLLTRLRDEGLYESDQLSTENGESVERPERGLPAIQASDSRKPVRRSSLWSFPSVRYAAIAASTITVSIGILTVALRDHDESEPVYRGEPTQLILYVDDPEAKLSQINRRLQNSNITSRVQHNPEGDIFVTIPSTLESIELIDSLGLARPAQAGDIVIVLRKKGGNAGPQRNAGQE